MAKQTWDDDDSGDVVKGVIDDNFTELYNLDALGYGFEPSASAATNTAALQAAVLNGNKRIYIRAGTYEMNDTVLLDDNTHIYCEPGTILKKTAEYCQVFLNRGALTQEYNENIIIEGLEISLNGHETVSSLVGQLSGNMAFYYVKNLTIKKFICTDGGVQIFMFVIVQWENIILDDIYITSEKDGIHLGVGSDALLRDIILETKDDGLILNGTAFPRNLVEVGDISNIIFENCIDRTPSGQTEAGNFLLIIGASWTDWAGTNTYNSSDLCENASKLYQCVNSAGFSAVASNAPVHDSGEVTGADTITWRYLQAAPTNQFVTFTSIKMVRCSLLKTRNVLNLSMFDNINLRSAYPGTEDQCVAYDVSVSDCYFSEDIVPNPIVNYGFGRDLRIVNNYIQNNGAIYYNPNTTSFVATVNVLVQGNIIQGSGRMFQISQPGESVIIQGGGNILDNYREATHSTNASTRINDTSLLISSTAERNKLDPVVGDQVRDVDGLWIYKAGGWVNLAV